MSNTLAKEETKTMAVREVPTQLRNEFHAVCAREGVSMRKVILSFMRKTVEAGKVPKE